MKDWITMLLAAIAIITGVCLLCSVPVWLLWNMTLISVFPAISSISLGQALGLTLLCGFLFGGKRVSSKD